MVEYFMLFLLSPNNFVAMCLKNMTLLAIMVILDESLFLHLNLVQSQMS